MDAAHAWNHEDTLGATAILSRADSAAAALGLKDAGGIFPAHSHLLFDNAEALVERLVQVPMSISVVIVDMASPGLDGFEGLDLINTTVGDSVPVLALVDRFDRDQADMIVTRPVADILIRSELSKDRIEQAVYMATARNSRRLADLAEVTVLKQEIAEHRDRGDRLQDHSTEMAGVVEDLAAARDELTRINASKDRFFSIIAHDLKSPFTPIIGYTRLLMEMAHELTPDKVESYATAIYRSAESASTLLEDLLEWSRLQLGGKTMEARPLAVARSIETHISRYVTAAESKGIRFEKQIEGDPVAFADKDMTATVLRNLISNAIKFTKSGGTITLGASANDGVVSVFVRDNGVGIEADRLDAIFDIGEKSSTLGSTGEKGTGLGLAICKEMIEQQGGRISVESTPGKGTTFTFTLPEDES